MKWVYPNSVFFDSKKWLIGMINDLVSQEKFVPDSMNKPPRYSLLRPRVNLFETHSSVNCSDQKTQKQRNWKMNRYDNFETFTLPVNTYDKIGTIIFHQGSPDKKSPIEPKPYPEKTSSLLNPNGGLFILHKLWIIILRQIHENL